MISVIIVQYNRTDLTIRALGSLKRWEPDCEIVVVDNGSTEADAAELQEQYPGMRLISMPTNTGFGSANNRGALEAKGRKLFFMNNDAYLTRPILSDMAAYLDTHPDVGACGPVLENEDGSFQLSSGSDPSILSEWQTRSLQKDAHRQQRPTPREHGSRVDWVTGAALFMDARLFRELEGFDDRFFMYFEDSDLCRRIRKHGKRVELLSNLSMRHSRGGSMAENVSPRIVYEYRRSQIRYYQKHASALSRVMLRAYLVAKSMILYAHAFAVRGDASAAGAILRAALGRTPADVNATR